MHFLSNTLPFETIKVTMSMLRDTSKGKVHVHTDKIIVQVLAVKYYIWPLENSAPPNKDLFKVDLHSRLETEH